MKKQIRIFQANRQYGTSGQVLSAQIIFAQVIKTLEDNQVLVEFHDLTQAVSGQLSLREFSEAAILEAYNLGNFPLIPCAEISVLGLLSAGGKRQEIIPTFKIHTTAFYQGNEVYILKTSTYCQCCDRFLDEVLYSLRVMETKYVFHKIPESQLSLEPPNDF